MKYDKQDQQGKAALYELNPHTTQQTEPAARSQEGSQTSKKQARTYIVGNKQIYKRNADTDTSSRPSQNTTCTFILIGQHIKQH
jgi:hypothetical protein